MKTDFDILVVGGGMVGASLACALRDTPLSIGVVEAAPFPLSESPSYDDRTVALAYGSRRIFDGMGLWDCIEPGANPIRRIHISDRGRFGITRLDAADARLPALGYVVPNRALGAALYHVMNGAASITTMCPATVADIEFEPARARVRVRHGEDERVLTARLVVAADGADSPTRAAVGIEARRVTYDQVAVVTSISTERAHDDTAYERFTESGPLALLPAGPDRLAVVWSVTRESAESMLAWDEATFRARLQDAFGERLGRIMRVGRRQSYPLVLTRVAEHARPRLALIGNAAHTVHPVAGQGFNLGLRDVAALSQVLLDGMAAGTDIGDVALLSRYAEWRRRDNRLTSGFTHSLVRIFSNDRLPLVCLRNLGLVAVDLLPPLKRAFIRVTSGMAGRLPRLACGLPLSGKPRDY
jgi:2-octaprenyl-6-methoxyphenol hydroxylase